MENSERVWELEVRIAGAIHSCGLVADRSRFFKSMSLIANLTEHFIRFLLDTGRNPYYLAGFH